MIIYHITTATEWNQALARGFYEAASLHSEGFIHCSTAAQVDGVLKRYFAGKKHLVKLVIDTDKIKNELKFELSPSLNEAFPHVYGTLNPEAVIEVVAIEQ